jgi:gamma-glutamyl-gamma-aminobutyrate hydrolase PuuD
VSVESKFGGTKTWGIKEIPQFPEGVKAMVLPGAFYGNVVSLMAEAGFSKTNDLSEADVVVFTGGGDISPTLYNEKPKVTHGVSPERDAFEVAMYDEAKKAGKVMFGICRGAQFLHAMNGGKLWQDVNNHGRQHYIVDLDEDVRVMATSIHHQMLQEKEEMELVAVCESTVATRFIDADLHVDLSSKDSSVDILEIEAGAYPLTKCFFVQGHPEVGSAEYRSWCMTKLLDYYREWADLLPKIEQIIPEATGRTS